MSMTTCSRRILELVCRPPGWQARDSRTSSDDPGRGARLERAGIDAVLVRKHEPRRAPGHLTRAKPTFPRLRLPCERRESSLFSGGSPCGVGLLVSGCGSAAEEPVAVAAVKPATPHCAYPAGWGGAREPHSRRRSIAPVWLPDPLTDQLKARGTTSTRSALTGATSKVSSGRTPISAARAASSTSTCVLPGPHQDPGLHHGRRRQPERAVLRRPARHITEQGIKATLFTVNQDADEWHLLLAWRHAGGL